MKIKLVRGKCALIRRQNMKCIESKANEHYQSGHQPQCTTNLLSYIINIHSYRCEEFRFCDLFYTFLFVRKVIFFFFFYIFLHSKLFVILCVVHAPFTVSWSRGPLIVRSIEFYLCLFLMFKSIYFIFMCAHIFQIHLDSIAFSFHPLSVDSAYIFVARSLSVSTLSAIAQKYIYIYIFTRKISTHERTQKGSKAARERDEQQQKKWHEIIAGHKTMKRCKEFGAIEQCQPKTVQAQLIAL